MKINPCENFSAIIIIIIIISSSSSSSSSSSISITIISFFKADFYITFYNYKKPIKVNKSQLK